MKELSDLEYVLFAAYLAHEPQAATARVTRMLAEKQTARLLYERLQKEPPPELLISVEQAWQRLHNRIHLSSTE